MTAKPLPKGPETVSLRDEMSNWLVGFMAGYGVRLDDGDARLAIEYSPLSLPLSLLPPKGWRPMASAPRDRSYILARVGPLEPDNRWGHLTGRCFVIRHDGVTETGVDLGWAVYPGFGGADDCWFDCWTDLPAAPVTKTVGGG